MFVSLFPPKQLVANKNLLLTASKSESNRALIIAALNTEKTILHNLSHAEDTQLLKAILELPHYTNVEINCKDAGTTFRFLTAFFACTPCSVTLTGSPRMQQRPIKILVDALRSLGASISYLGKEGFPPLQISGKKLENKKLLLDAGISSQYISALLLIAPRIKDGLSVSFLTEPVSLPYILLTISMLQKAGVKARFEENSIQIDAQDYSACTFAIENDWSAASYWYMLATLSPKASFFMPGLRKNSLQGDAVVATLFESFGIETLYLEEGVQLVKKPVSLPSSFDFDFTHCPDLAQTLAVTCAALNIPCRLSGLQTLRIKETERIAALCAELQKTGAAIRVEESILIIEKGCAENLSNDLQICTYNDHRMAMAFAGLSFLYPGIQIENPDVVGKSYPHFWTDLQTQGFVVVKE